MKHSSSTGKTGEKQICESLEAVEVGIQIIFPSKVVQG